MWTVVLVSGVIAGVLSLGAAGRVDTPKGKPLPQSVPFASIRSAAFGLLGLGRQPEGRLSVTVPQEDAELSVNGEPRTGSGLVRDVVITPRSPGVTEAQVTVSWQPNTYTVLTRRATVRIAAGATAALDLSQDSPGDSALIRYVPTPSYVVAEMIALAGVTKSDVVFEPGCGDARLTIAAVKAAGLGKRIEIRRGDALAIPDLSEASLVFLYMGDEFNRLIRPILQRQLKVGARVVSHRFTMGDWVPDQTVSLPDEGGNTDLHLWTITAVVKAAQP